MKKITGTLVFMIMIVVFFSAAALADGPTMQLGEVVVTATKTEKNPDDVTQAVTVVTADEIKRSGATDVASAIQNTVGVNIGSFGTPGSVEALRIRGSSTSQVLVMLDGKRMNSARDGGFDLSALPVSVDDIQRIEIVRGPASALYGSDAVGGVINIITKKPSESKNVLGASVGSHGYDDLFLNTSSRQGGWYYSLSGERETSNGYRVNSDSYQWVAGGKIGYDISKTDFLEMTANYLTKENGSPGSVKDATPTSADYATPYARQQDRNTVLGASYHGKFGQSLDLDLSGYRKEDDLTYRDPTPLASPTLDRYQTKSDGSEARFSWLVASWNQLTAGYERRRDGLDSFDAQSGTAEHSASLWAYYAQDEISIGDALIVDVGGRHDEHSVYGGKFSPKASARYLVSSTDTILRASYGKSFRAPTFNDLFFNSSYAVGNPFLRPESAKEYDASIEQKLGKSGRVMIGGFDRKVQDLINWDWTVFPMRVVNIGRVHIRGLETEAGLKLSDAASLDVNYTYTNPVDELTGQKIYYTIPRRQVKGSLTTVLAPDVSLTIDGRTVENYVEPGMPEWHYAVVDAKIAQKIGKEKRGEVYFAMTNLFDRVYDVVPGYPAPPKEIRGGVTLLF
jgi:outer membrane cobalamin receptor